LNEAAHAAELDQLAAEWKDRCGRLPVSVENLLLCMRIRLEAGSRRVSMVEVREDRLMLTRRGDFLLISGKFPRLTRAEPNSRLREVSDFVEGLEK